MESRKLLPGNLLRNLNAGGFASILYGLLAAVVAILFLSFVCSAAVYFSSMSESWLYIFAVLIQVLALFVGGFIAGRKGKNRGLWRGCGVALCVMVLMFLTGNLPLAQFGTKLAFSLPAGALGGICGVK